MPGLIELAEITRSGRRKVSRAELVDAIIQEYGGDTRAAVAGLIKIYLPLMTELREMTGECRPASDDQVPTCPATLADVIIREDCDGDARQAALTVLGMNLALTAELRELTGKRAYERAGAVH
jgi:hypothetical protein